MSAPQPICSVVLHHYGIIAAQNGLSALLADEAGQTVYSIQVGSTPTNPIIQTRNVTSVGPWESFNVEGNLASIHPTQSGIGDGGVLTFAIKSAVGLS